MTYSDVIKHPTLSRLITVQFLSYFGSFFSFVAISTLFIKLEVSALEIGIVMSMYFLPSMLLSIFNGYIIDTFSFKKLILWLLGVEMAMTLLFTTVNDAEHIYLLAIFIFIRSGASTLIFASEMAMLPKIIDGELLKKTNDIHSIIWSSSYAFGMALGALSVYYFGFFATFLSDFALYLIAFFIILKTPLAIPFSKTKESFLHMTQSAFIYIKNHPKIIHLITLHASIGLTIFDVIVTLLADSNYKHILAASLAIGIINFSRAIALSIGPHHRQIYQRVESVAFYASSNTLYHHLGKSPIKLLPQCYWDIFCWNFDNIALLIYIFSIAK